MDKGLIYTPFINICVNLFFPYKNNSYININVGSLHKSHFLVS